MSALPHDTDVAPGAGGDPASGAADAGAEPVDLLVDWDLAARTAVLAGRSGPRLPREQADDVVAQLRAAAPAAVEHVASVTGLTSPSTPPGAAVLVVDRAGWARANADAFRELLRPVVAEAFDRRGRGPAPAVSAVGRRVAAVEVGGLLGYLSGRVLGQYDAFGAGPGRLLLVAPNVVRVGTELGVDAADFRLWVCLHEETHRVQFGANPWLREHLVGEVRGIAADLMIDPSQLTDRLLAVARDLPDLLRGTGSGSGAPLLDAVQTPAQRERLARLTAVMSLLEGHADVVMDEVGPQVVPSVQTIRARFSTRRAGRGTVDRLLRRLLGLEAKLRQYADGARFVRQVVATVGMSGFNRVWESPGTLPQPSEIADPVAWVRRVHR